MITIRIGNPTHSETKVKDYKEAIGYLWALHLSAWSDYAEYTTRTGRVINNTIPEGASFCKDTIDRWLGLDRRLTIEEWREIDSHINRIWQSIDESVINDYPKVSEEPESVNNAIIGLGWVFSVKPQLKIGGGKTNRIMWRASHPNYRKEITSVTGQGLVKKVWITHMRDLAESQCNA